MIFCRANKLWLINLLSLEWFWSWLFWSYFSVPARSKNENEKSYFPFRFIVKIECDLDEYKLYLVLIVFLNSFPSKYNQKASSISLTVLEEFFEF